MTCDSSTPETITVGSMPALRRVARRAGEAEARTKGTIWPTIDDTRLRPVPTEKTRTGLIDAATRAFADDGVQAASLVEITRRAGQRNRGAVQYHFGGRDGLLVAVLDQHADFLAEREGELLDAARARPDHDVAAVVEAIVRPAVELAEIGWRGRCYLVILDELIEQDPDVQAVEVAAALARTGGYQVYALLAHRMSPMDDELRNERFALLTSFILGSVARRARATVGTSGRHQLSSERFVANLIALGTAMMTVPSVPVEAGVRDLTKS